MDFRARAAITDADSDALSTFVDACTGAIDEWRRGHAHCTFVWCIDVGLRAAEAATTEPFVQGIGGAQFLAAQRALATASTDATREQWREEHYELAPVHYLRSVYDAPERSADSRQWVFERYVCEPLCIELQSTSAGTGVPLVARAGLVCTNVDVRNNGATTTTTRDAPMAARAPPAGVVERVPERLLTARWLAARQHDPFANAASRAGTPAATRLCDAHAYARPSAAGGAWRAHCSHVQTSYRVDEHRPETHAYHVQWSSPFVAAAAARAHIDAALGDIDAVFGGARAGDLQSARHDSVRRARIAEMLASH